MILKEINLMNKMSEISRASETSRTSDINKVISIKNAEEYKKLKSLGLVVVDYYTTWCSPCKKFSPIFQEIAEQNPGVKFLSVDAESIEHEDCENIKSVPTFRIFFNGNMKREFSGVNREKLERYIKRYEVQIFINGRTQRSFTEESKQKIIDYMNNIIYDDE